MSTFQSYLTNPNFAQAYGFDKDRKGIVYIENERDTKFWSTLIETIYPNSYKFKSSTKSNSLGRGKRQLEQLYDRLSDVVLVAIDSDFDYISPERNENSVKINNNKFILQTFAFSRESILCNTNTLNINFKKVRYAIQTEFDITQVLYEYSKICYTLLVPYAYLMNIKSSCITESQFHECFLISGAENIINEDLKMNRVLIESIRQKAEDQANQLEHLIADHEDYAAFKRKLLAMSINEANAYQFISGHVLMDQLISPIARIIRCNLLKREINEIKKTNPTKEQLQQLISGIRNHFKDRCSFHTLIENCDSTYMDPICNRILDSIKRVRE